MTHAQGEGEPEGSPPSGQQVSGLPPGWGQQPWGGEAGGGHAAPGGRGRHSPGLMVALAAAALAVVAGIAVLAMSTGPTVLSRAAVERDVAAQFEQREGVPVDLRCAQEMLVEEGATYECSGSTADDEEVTLRIEITHADGARYTWSEP